MMMKTTLASLLLLIYLVTAGCVGSPIHSTFRYNSVQSAIERNNENLLRMRIGMTQTETSALMGKPERSEGYAWGSAWLYRSAMTSGVYGTADADFTPIVFDEKGLVVGWGRNFFVEHVKRFDFRIKVDKE